MWIFSRGDFLIDLWVACILDFFIGDPVWLYHPVQLFGLIISKEESIIRKFPKSHILYKAVGFLITLFNVVTVFSISFFLLKSVSGLPAHLIRIYILFSSDAAGSLRDAAVSVKKALEKSVEDGRRVVAMFVGRDTDKLSEEEVLKATIETVAENASDGVIAPLFFALLFDAPGAFAYKMVNTMDSMLGYKNERYENLGFFPAINDDIWNFIPARLTAFLMAVSSLGIYDIGRGIKVFFRDKNKHKSPNSAKPEAMMAGLLGISLGGERTYGGKKQNDGVIGDEIYKINSEHIHGAVNIMFRSELLFLLIATGLSFLT